MNLDIRPLEAADRWSLQEASAVLQEAFGSWQSGEDHRLRNLQGRPCPVCGIPCRCSGILFIHPLPIT